MSIAQEGLCDLLLIYGRRQSRALKNDETALIETVAAMGWHYRRSGDRLLAIVHISSCSSFAGCRAMDRLKRGSEGNITVPVIIQLKIGKKKTRSKVPSIWSSRSPKAL